MIGLPEHSALDGRPHQRPRFDRNSIQSEKFYLFDVGLASHLARHRPRLGSAEIGKRFEHLVLMEPQNYRRCRAPGLDIRFWRTSTGAEVDFVLGDMAAAIEVKGVPRVHTGDLRGLRALGDSHRVGRRRLVVCLERERRVIEVLLWAAFVRQLWAGEVAR